METSHILSVLESLLFVSGEPLSFNRLAKALHVEEVAIREAAQVLAKKYTDDKERGLMVILHHNQVRIATKPENIEFVEELTKSALQESLSKAALEVLSIIAYRAPVSRAEIDAIRGVNCSFTLRNLLLRDLIEREGNPQDARGYIYRPSFRFLEALGLGKVEELPDFTTLSQDERLTTLLEKETEEGEGEVSQPATETSEPTPEEPSSLSQS